MDGVIWWNEAHGILAKSPKEKGKEGEREQKPYRYVYHGGYDNAGKASGEKMQGTRPREKGTSGKIVGGFTE